MIPQIKKRRIGNVMIVDIKGALSGAWALKGMERLRRMLAFERAEKLIFNFRETTDLDTLGAKSIFESVPKNKQAGILCGSTTVMEVIRHFPEYERFRVFHDEQEIVSTFGQDLTPALNLSDSRTSVRLQTALPLEFYYEEEGEKIEFRAIVTNLSENGLFAEYIDLKSAEKSLERLNPNDLKRLHLIISFPRRKAIKLEGNVVHCKLDEEQVGIGIQFSQIGSCEQEEIRRFLGSQGVENLTATQLPERTGY